MVEWSEQDADRNWGDVARLHGSPEVVARAVEGNDVVSCGSSVEGDRRMMVLSSESSEYLVGDVDGVLVGVVTTVLEVDPDPQIPAVFPPGSRVVKMMRVRLDYPEVWNY